jgi:hypothetical protein
VITDPAPSGATTWTPKGLLVDVIREVEERQRTVLAEMVADPGQPGQPGEEPAAREAAGIDPETARAAARLWVAVGRGLLLDVLATGDNDEVDAAMRFFADMMLATLQARLSEPPAENQ